MLIRNAEVWGLGPADLRLADGVIRSVGKLQPLAGEPVLDAAGGALLPGLHDHHLHLASAAVRRQSVVCGPPEVTTAEQLAQRILSVPGDGWIRGILYHDSVMGLPDAQALDRMVRDRPLRIQHRSGRMWLLNSLALQNLLALSPPPAGLEREAGHYTGHLFDEDTWLRRTLNASPPPLGDISRELARFGVTGLTDMSPSNTPETLDWFSAAQASGQLRQHLLMAGTLELARGPAKLHLHENALPDFDEVLAFIRTAHGLGRPLAVHCTTETELVFTLAALEAAGTMPGDRIEHAGIATDDHIARIADMGLAVVSQPHFIAERGDQYRADVEPAQVPLLYRLASFKRAGVTLAAGSDAPFGSLDPWAAMRAAVTRRTPSGAVIGPDEALTPEEALALYLADPEDLSRLRTISEGTRADLCLLRTGWAEARERLDASIVRATFIAGDLVHQSPFEGGAG
ncbi:hydrolase [Novosphingobium sp. TH158]|nr:hydrolase [Novosphingobium sp. TH158]